MKAPMIIKSALNVTFGVMAELHKLWSQQTLATNELAST
jgi:hypothetical protein